MNDYIEPTKFSRKLVIHDREHFDSVLEYQGKHMNQDNWNKGRDLETKINWLLLGNYGGADTLNIFKDHSPNCFGLSLMLGDRCILNGGIICHGQEAEVFSVDLTNAKGIYFGIHT